VFKNQRTGDPTIDKLGKFGIAHPRERIHVATCAATVHCCQNGNCCTYTVARANDLAGRIHQPGYGLVYQWFDVFENLKKSSMYKDFALVVYIFGGNKFALCGVLACFSWNKPREPEINVV
jgi:hypothetical protein